MEVVIAGDIIGSKKNNPNDYLEILEPILKKFSKKGMYQIFRGDSFQAWIKTPEHGLLVCILIKTALKRTDLLDVRIAIGLGEVKVVANDIAKSTGSALIRSGELLDSLKEQGQNIMVKSNYPRLDRYMNVALQIALIHMNDWTKNGAAALYEAYNNPMITQKEIGEKLGIKQATASRRLNRVHIKETDSLLNLFHDNYYKDVKHGTIS